LFYIYLIFLGNLEITIKKYVQITFDDKKTYKKVRKKKLLRK